MSGFCYKSVNLPLEELKNVKIILFPIQELFRQQGSPEISHSLTNSAVMYNPFGTKICMSISFQLLLYIIEVKYQEDQ